MCLESSIFGPQRVEMGGDRTEVHDEELCSLFSSTHTVMIKLRGLRWTGHVACIR
jgi:hypothetical protein